MIYLDNNATTPVDPRVVQAVRPFLETHWANPSSPYRPGREASRALVEARESAAALLGAVPAEIVFTSGGTESINLALHAALAARPDRRRVVISAVEHAAVQACLDRLGRRESLEVVRIPVSADGALDCEAFRNALTSDTALVSMMMANNETGVCLPLGELVADARSCGALVHTDAVQWVGKRPVDVRELDVDFLSFSGHKIHAPKGVGGLWVRQGQSVEPLIAGGDQERGRRGGTENVPGIVGLGAAADLAAGSLVDQPARLAALRNRLEAGLRERVEHVRITGADLPRLPNTTHLSIEGVESEALLMRLDEKGIFCSSGSACASGSPEPSHVLEAMGWPMERNRSAIRICLSRMTGEEDVDTVLDQLPGLVRELRALDAVDESGRGGR